MEGKVKFIVPSDKREYGYVGLDLETDSAKFVFPCRYLPDDADANTQKAEAKKLLLLIKRAQEEYYFGGDSEERTQFFSMMWLIRDYIENGYYTETERVIRRSPKGKIDWKHTVQKSRILVDRGNLIFRDFYTYRNMLDPGNTLTHIYKCCFGYSVRTIGFLYGISEAERSVFQMERASDVNYMCHVVQKEQNKSFNSYKKMLLSHLLTILKGAQGKLHAVSLYMHDSEFEYVFETLINEVFGTEDVSAFYNQYSYFLKTADGKETRYATSRLRPDTIMKLLGEDGDEYFVIDAKYYNFGYSRKPKDLPQSSSITKQIGYAHYLSDHFTQIGAKTLFNSALMLPEALSGDPLEYIGYAASGETNEAMDKVAVCLIDLRTLVDVFYGTAAKADGSPRSRDDLREKLRGLLCEKCFLKDRPPLAILT